MQPNCSSSGPRGRPDFDAAHEPVGAVAEICRRLDGVPLAIELAAARMRAMSSLDVARRLDRLRLLSGGARGAHPRQQSVAATIDWSYRLLAEKEQALFDRLSVFAGGFDLEAAHGVCADEGKTEDDTLDLLTGLVDKSMVFSAAAPWRLVTAYSRPCARTGGNDCRTKGLPTDRGRHAHYYLELVEHSKEGMHSAEEQAWVERMAPDAGTLYASPDFDNLRTAFEHVMSAGEATLRSGLSPR